MNSSPYFDDAMEMFRDTVRTFTERYASREYARQCDRDASYPYELYKKLAQEEWLGLPFPEELGGLNASWQYTIILHEELSRHCYDFANVFGVPVSIGLRIARVGTESQKRHYIPRLLRGEIKFSVAFTEPDAGSDVGALKLRAVRDGDHFVLNGQKAFNTGADAEGNIMLVAVRTSTDGPKHHGITMLLVDNRLPGLTLRRLNTLGRRPKGTFEVFYENVRVPAECVLGEIDQGWSLLAGHLGVERVCVSASYIGNAQQAVDDARRYAQERHQFGRPIGKFQAVSHRLADMQSAVSAARLLVYQAGYEAAHELPSAGLSISMAKLIASQAYEQVTIGAMQILGAYSQLPEYDVERYWRDARASQVAGGTTEILRSTIARQLGL